MHAFFILHFWKGVDWTHVAQDSNDGRVLVNTVTNLRVPQDSEDNSE
jgi:hypothetical protein